MITKLVKKTLMRHSLMVGIYEKSERVMTLGTGDCLFILR